MTTDRKPFRRILPTLLGVLASGCTATQAYRTVVDFRGQPSTTAFQRFGPPDSERVDNGLRVYVWQAEHGGRTCELTVPVDAAGTIVEPSMLGYLPACQVLLDYPRGKPRKAP